MYVVVRLLLIPIGVLFIAWGFPQVTEGPAGGRAGFGFGIVLICGGLTALFASAVGPSNRGWWGLLTVTGMALAAVGLVIAWALYVTIAKPDFQ
jgi:hypothetical protein